MATSYPHASVAAWLVFFFAIGWLGCAASCWRGRGLGWAIPITFGLAAVMFCVVYDLLGEMGVLQVFLNGHAVAPGVYTLMQLGFVPMIAALILGGIVAVRFGRVIWGRGA